MSAYPLEHDMAPPGADREGRTTSTPALHYTVRAPRNGRQPRHTVVLSHALGCDLTMWDALAYELAADCRVIAYDGRGHGGADVPDGDYTMAQLADDAARLLRELDTGPVVFVGLSMGGMAGQELALRHPLLVAALVLSNTTSGYPAAARKVWRERAATVRAQGLEAIADSTMERYFHARFRAGHPEVVARFRARLLRTDARGYAGCCAAVENVDTTARLGTIAAPTLVIAGAVDEATPVAMAQTLADGIAGARLEILADASHLGAVVQAQAFNRAVLDFIGGLPPAGA